MSFVAVAIGGIGLAGGIGSALIGSSAAGNAADTQAQSANYAANLQHQDTEDALGFQQGVYNNAQQETAPYLNTGYGGLANLAYLSGILPMGSGQGGTASFTPNGATIPEFLSGPGANSAMAATPNYNGQSFSQLVNSGDPNVSPNAQTTQAWQAQGIPFQNITTSDGRSVAIKTSGSGPQAGTPAQSGINVPQGTPGLQSLVNTNLGASGSLLSPYPGGQFQAPTNVTEQNDPGFQFRLDQGQKLLENSAASRGDLLSGATAKGLIDYGQGAASAEYGNVYNRALSTYDTNYNAFEQNQTNTYNRLAALAGIGQTSTQQLGQAGQSAANNISNTLLTSGQQIGNNINNAGAARASGYVGSANAWTGALNNLTSSVGSLYALHNLNGGGGSTPTTPTGGWDQYYGYGG